MFTSETTGPFDLLSGENKRGRTGILCLRPQTAVGAHIHRGHREWPPQPRPPSADQGAGESSSFRKASARNRKLLPFLSILSQHFLFCFKKHSLSVAQPFPCPGQPQAQTHPQTSAFLLGFLPTIWVMRFLADPE